MVMETHVTLGGDAATPSSDPPTDGVAPAGPVAPPVSRLPKKQLVSCAIEAHTIQKCPSPKKKALDPLRYMPERASYHALFSVVARFEDHADEYHVLRSYAQFRALHAQLQKKFPKSRLPKDLPSLRKKRFDNDYIEQKTAELSAYLAQLVGLCEVRQCKILRDFLEEHPTSEVSDDDDAVPTKMLDGLPGTIVSVRAGQSFTVSLRLQTAGDTASWQFTTKKHNIGFSATFNGTNVRVYSREDSQLKPVKGSFKCLEAGTLTLDWDNTYTWSKTKVLVYWAEVEQSRTLTFGSDVSSAADPGTPATDATPLVDGRRAGYIAQSRNPSQYPRQIVNTSLSLIAKPFTRARQNQSAQFKTGSLIVERNVKFRGRNWYRKWFVLDTHKCLLRYYDSEQASRKGLSLAKINLSTKNACLAITSQDEAAPTPYMFMVRARKRCWKMCASSQAEYNEWEHAISTAILTAQLKRRSKRAKSAPRDEKNDQQDAENLDDDESEDEDDEDEDDEEDDEHGKEDEDDTEEEENDSDINGAHDPPMPLDPRSPGTIDTALVAPLEAQVQQREETCEVVLRNPLEQRQSLVSVCVCEHWLCDLRRLSSAKKLLVVLWLNTLVVSLRSCSLVTVVLTALIISAYALIHALEAAPSRRAHIALHDKHV